MDNLDYTNIIKKELCQKIIAMEEESDCNFVDHILDIIKIMQLFRHKDVAASAKERTEENLAPIPNKMATDGELEHLDARTALKNIHVFLCAANKARKERDEQLEQCALDAFRALAKIQHILSDKHTGLKGIEGGEMTDIEEMDIDEDLMDILT